MTCHDVRPHLLDAPPDRLRPAAGSDLGRHLSECPECRRAAALLEGARRELDAWLGVPPPPLDAAAVLERARTDPDRSFRELPAGRAPRRGLRRVLGLGLPLAAAAGLAALLVTRAPSPPRVPAVQPAAGPAVDASPAAAPDRGLALDVPAGRHAAVIETSNPDITVVWFFSGD